MSSSIFAGIVQWNLLDEVANWISVECQILSGPVWILCVADIRRTEFAKYSERHESYRFSWTSKSRKAFSFRGASPPEPVTRGSAPGLRWGVCPQTSVISSRSALAMGPPNLRWRHWNPGVWGRKSPNRIQGQSPVTGQGDGTKSPRSWKLFEKKVCAKFGQIWRKNIKNLIWHFVWIVAYILFVRLAFSPNTLHVAGSWLIECYNIHILLCV